MAVKQDPPDGYLDRFSNPLWRAAGLVYPTAISIVEGTRGGYPFTVLELSHRSLKLRREAGEDITTVFILNLGRSSTTWQNTVPTHGGVTVWVDQCYLFLARIGADTPVAEWNSLLAQAISAAATVTDVPGPAPVEEPRIRAGTDRGMVMLWIVTAGLLPSFEWMSGLVMLAREVLSSVTAMVLGTQVICQPLDQGADPMAGHNMWLFGLALCLPFLGQFHGLSIIYNHYGRKGFTWRIVLNGFLVSALAIGGFALAMEYTYDDEYEDLPPCSAPQSRVR